MTSSGSQAGNIPPWTKLPTSESNISRHKGPVRSAAFSADGTRIVTASRDGTARIRDVRFATMSMQNLIIEVCTRRLPGITS